MFSFQAAQRIKTPAKYIVGTSTIPFNPSAFLEVNIKSELHRSVLTNCCKLFSHSSLHVFPLASSDHALSEDVFGPQCRGHAHVHTPVRHAG